RGKVKGDHAFSIDDYITELEEVAESKASGMTIDELKDISKADIQILGLVRNGKRIHAPNTDEVLMSKDIIILEGDTEAIKVFVEDAGLKLVGDKKFRKDAVNSDNVVITEAIVTANARLIGRTASGIRMRSRYGVNLMAVSRQHKKIHIRLDRVVLRTGDIIMIQARTHLVDEAIRLMGCLPLAERGLKIGFQKRITVSLLMFIGALVLIMTNLLP